VVPLGCCSGWVVPLRLVLLDDLALGVVADGVGGQLAPQIHRLCPELRHLAGRVMGSLVVAPREMVFSIIIQQLGEACRGIFEGPHVTRCVGVAR
jgi:hypothetical protein